MLGLRRIAGCNMDMQRDAARGLKRVLPLMGLAAFFLILFWIDQRTAFWDRSVSEVSQFGQSLAEIEPDYSAIPPDDYEGPFQKAMNEAQAQGLCVAHYPSIVDTAEDWGGHQLGSGSDDALIRLICAKLASRRSPTTQRKDLHIPVTRLCRAFGSELTAAISQYDSGLIVVVVR